MVHPILFACQTATSENYIHQLAENKLEQVKKQLGITVDSRLYCVSSKYINLITHAFFILPNCNDVTKLDTDRDFTKFMTEFNDPDYMHPMIQISIANWCTPFNNTHSISDLLNAIPPNMPFVSTISIPNMMASNFDINKHEITNHELYEVHLQMI